MTYEEYNANVVRPQGGEELIIASGGKLTLKSGAVIATADGVGAAGTYVTAAERGIAAVHHTRLTLTNAVVPVVVEALAVGYGSIKIYDMPAGAILFLGAVANLTCARVGTDIAEDYDGDFGIGTAAADNDAGPLATTEQNIIPNTATPQAVAGATTAKGQSTAAENIVVNGTTTAVDVFLNMLVDIADISGDDGITVNGTIDLIWVNLGDY